MSSSFALGMAGLFELGRVAGSDCNACEWPRSSRAAAQTAFTREKGVKFKVGHG